MNGLNLQEMATSAYNIIKTILTTAIELTGLDTLWARATPVINSEDVVLLEYTLSEVGLECPLQIKILTSNTDYNPGNFTVDLFGINYDAPMEILITITEWEKTFGSNTMPQKGDIVYIKILHKLYEVATSEVIYQIASMPTYYKCQLTKYNPTASRKETEEFRVSIDELTVTQEDLFGDAISQEVADTVNTVETAYNNTTFVDPVKNFDTTSIVEGPIIGSDGNLISNAYYDFSIAETNITYHINAIYETSAERNHWIYSCWFRDLKNNIENGKIFKMSFYSKDLKYYYYTLNSSLKLDIGDELYITRGNLIKVYGVIIPLTCEDGYGIQVNIKDALKANKALTEWYKTNNLRIYKTMPLNLLTGYNNEERLINIKYIPISNLLDIRINNVYKQIKLNAFNINSWNYIAFDISPKELRILHNHLYLDGLYKLTDKILFDHTEKISLNDFEISEFRIESINTGLQLCNIRLYENEYELGDTYIKDMYSPITRNASKLILVDSPNIPSLHSLQTPVR